MQEAAVPTGRRRKITGSNDGEPVLLAADPPIYAAVALQWRQASRMLPGQVDPEWSELVADVPDLGLRSGQDAGLPSGVVLEAGGAGAVGGGPRWGRLPDTVLHRRGAGCAPADPGADQSMVSTPRPAR
jgi:hypothetical protein